jgi:hypothetical protein
VNPERLLQHFERLSEAPDAIPRLRQFILDLAVQGQLVPQDPNDEPAVGLQHSSGFNGPEIRRIQRLIEEYHSQLVEAWNAYFSN